MKKLMMIAIMVTGLSLTLYSASYAVTLLSLNGNDYKITAFCRDDAGDYCSKGDVKHDAFTFEDGDNFIVDSFGGGVVGVGGSGAFNEDGLSFTANYQVITENSLDKYTFDVKGINLIDTIIIGQMDVTYYQLNITGYDKQDETKAFFFGTKK
jgi:hypothetical protein